MGRKDKLIDRFLTFPKDFTFDELEALLRLFGYEKSNKGKTSGSRIIYKNEAKAPVMIHKPHPGNIVKRYALKQVYGCLKENGDLADKED